MSFDKYESGGAYHWRECDPTSPGYNPALVARYKMILDRVAGGSVLDVGAGDGYLTARLAERCSSVIGIESDPHGLAQADAMLDAIPNAEIRAGSATCLEFAAASFDSVAMADVIEHLDEPEAAVREMARVVRDTGTVYVTTPQWRPDRVWDVRHVKEYRPDELDGLMRSSFGEVELVFAWPLFWSNLYRTKIGWRALRWAARRGFNPFARESDSADGYGQMLAVARRPIRHG